MRQTTLLKYCIGTRTQLTRYFKPSSVVKRLVRRMMLRVFHASDFASGDMALLQKG